MSCNYHDQGDRSAKRTGCLIEGYDNDDASDEAPSEHIATTCIKRVRLNPSIVQSNESSVTSSSSSSSFFSSIASVDSEALLSQCSTEPFPPAFSCQFSLPRPKQELSFFQRPSPAIVNPAASKSNNTNGINEAPHHGGKEIVLEEDEDELIDISTSEFPQNPKPFTQLQKLGNLFTFPEDGGREQSDDDSSKSSVEEKPRIRRGADVGKKLLDTLKPSLWSVEGSLTAAVTLDGTPPGADRIEIWNATKSEPTQTIEKESIPKGREWKGLADMENGSASSITLSSDDLKDPNWRSNFERGEGRLKKSRAESLTWNFQKGTTEHLFEPSRRQKQKHQINWLAQNASNMELDILERSAQQKHSRYQTAMKYGW